ncbi:MAG: Spx/MgsR family RNA polymerase-binding regulatory protein [Erysipelotrichaceae bacterium]|nr:Spx/MgsR family RNA polymerase-binding regulatory protein [Erysipelotrichaceae bacterium]MDY5251670.1 Spx/MgsR family RNA polymerase-binding regulatory protein [Erysipelotrichaceae bacterium]
MYTVLCYSKCSTCQKALKYLDSKQIAYQKQDLKEDKPSYELLKELVSRSNLDINKFFNTSGLRYRELDLKNKLKTMSDEEKLQLLASDGMLVKRPIVFDEHVVIVGKKEAAYDELG